MKYEIKQAGALGKTVYIYENDTIREAGMLGKIKYIVKDGYIMEPGVFGKTVYKIDGNIIKTPGIFGKKVFSIENNGIYQGYNLIYKIVPVGERLKENTFEQTNKNVNFNVDFTITEVFTNPEYNELLAYRTFFNKHRIIKAPDRQETYSNWALASRGVEDPKKLHRELFDKGYYSESSIKDCLSTHKLSELKDFAKLLDINVKGKRDEIIDQLSKIITKEQFYQYFGNDKLYTINENADKYLKEHQLEYEYYDLPDNTMSLKDYLEKRKTLSKEDIKWQIYQQKLKNEKGLNPNTYFDMADLLIEEKKDKDAIMFLLRGLFFEFNDIQSYIKYKELGIPKSDELVRKHQIYLLRGIYDQQMADLKGYYESSMVDEVYNTYTKFQPCSKILFEKIIKSMFGVDVKGEKINTFSLDNVSVGVGGLGFNGTVPKIIDAVKEDSAIVIERYQRPDAVYPEGRLTIVAGDKLVYDDVLPFICGEDKTRDFPFVKQTSIEEPGCFWGTSVIERLVPVQRAYNAVKNRKHEFINRLSLGVLSVEDGSVDLDNLEDEGLCPGKVLVYRQGSSEPKYLQSESLPSGLSDEENNLLEEFNKISGVNDLVSASNISSNISGNALELLISQDETRLNASIESIKFAVKDIAKKILKLYKQYAIFPRIAKIIGENGQIEMFYFSSSDITSDDIELENQTDGSQTLAQRREMLFTLLDKGLLYDEDGKLSNRMKCKILEMLGLGIWENAQDVKELHIKKAGNENLKMLDGISCKTSEIDDDNLHLNEHIAFMLGEDFEKRKLENSNIEKLFLEHIHAHKRNLED